MKRLLSSMLALLLCVCVTFAFAACGKETPDGDEDVSAGEGGGDTGTNEEPADTENLVLITGNKARFKLVTTSDMSGTLKKKIEKFVNDLRDIGVDIDDPISDGSAGAVTDCEIIVGSGVKNRDEKYTVDPYSCGAEGYVIKVVDDKVVIGGGTVELTETAFDYFVKSVMKLSGKTKELSEFSIGRAYEKIKETDYLIDSVTVGGETKFACVDGPEFDGHQVDFAELMSRNATYRCREAEVSEKHACRMESMGKALIK